MQDALSEIESAINDHKRLTKRILKGTVRLVRSRDEVALIKSTAFTWFKDRRPTIALQIGDSALLKADNYYTECLTLSQKGSSRSTYKTIFLDLGKKLLEIQQTILTKPGKNPSSLTGSPPDFTLLVSDKKMQEILVRRWVETQRCIGANAPLSAVVMMGGLLEALILSRLNAMPDKEKAFKAKQAPKDKQGKTLPLKDWGLKNFLDVAHELGWIGQSAKDVGGVLRDYRNYIHPAKEYTYGLSVTPNDSLMMWTVFASLTEQLIASGENH